MYIMITISRCTSFCTKINLSYFYFPMNFFLKCVHKCFRSRNSSGMRYIQERIHAAQEIITLRVTETKWEEAAAWD